MTAVLDTSPIPLVQPYQKICGSDSFTETIELFVKASDVPFSIFLGDLLILAPSKQSAKVSHIRVIEDFFESYFIITVVLITNHPVTIRNNTGFYKLFRNTGVFVKDPTKVIKVKSGGL